LGIAPFRDQNPGDLAKKVARRRIVGHAKFAAWYDQGVDDGPRVVVADDDPMVRKLLHELLTRAGYAVTACASGQAALDAIYDAEPELLLTDLQMPGRSGLEVIRELRGRRLLLPIVLMSGIEEHPDIPAALAHSGVDFLPKPFRVAECRKAVARALGVRR
jgi:CheY-like chemotaxis protein